MNLFCGTADIEWMQRLTDEIKRHLDRLELNEVRHMRSKKWFRRRNKWMFKYGVPWRI